MKRFCFLAVTFLALQGATTAHAQVAGDPTSSLQTRSANLTRTLAAKMQLNEGQYVKVKNLNGRMLAEVDEVNTRYATDQVTKDKHLAEVQARYDSAMETVLLPNQLALYQHTRTSMTAFSSPAK